MFKLIKSLVRQLAEVPALNRERAKEASIRSRFTIDPDDVDGSLATIDKTIAAKMSEALNLFEEHGDKLLSGEWERLKTAIDEVNAEVTVFGSTPSDLQVLEVSRAFIELESVVSALSDGISSERRAAIWEYNQKYRDIRKSFDREIAKLQNDFPEAWTSDFTLSYSHVMEQEALVSSLPDLKNAYNALRGIVETHLPRARIVLEQRKKEQPLEWESLMRTGMTVEQQQRKMAMDSAAVKCCLCGEGILEDQDQWQWNSQPAHAQCVIMKAEFFCRECRHFWSGVGRNTYGEYWAPCPKCGRKTLELQERLRTYMYEQHG